MAISGSFYGTTSNSAIKPKITWSAEKNEAQNSSLVTATLSYSRTDSYKTYGHWAGNLTIQGDTKSVSGKYIEITKNSNTVTVTHSVTVPHNDDGSMSVTISASGSVSGTTLSKTKISAQVELEKIPRAASVAATDADIGSVSMVTIGKKSDAYTYTVAWQFGSLSGYLAESGISDTAKPVTASGLAFSLPEAFYYEIPDKATDICTLVCTTYLDGVAIGTPQKATFTVRANPSRCAPLLTAAVEDGNQTTVALTGDKQCFIRYGSTAICTMTPTARYGATITQKKIAGQKVTENSLSIPKIEADSVRFAVTDSRGYTTETVVTLNMVPYFLPTLRLQAGRTDATSGAAKLQAEGSFYNGSFGKLANALQVSYKLDGASAVNLQPQVDGNRFTAQQDLTNLDYTRSYTVSLTISDGLHSVTASARINPGVPAFDWGKDDFAFHIPVSMDGNRVMNLSAPTEDGDAVNMGYARTAFAPAGNYLDQCMYVSKTDTDLDTYLKDGWFYFGSSTAPVNRPIGSNGWLQVMSEGLGKQTYIKQFWYRMGSPNGTDHQTFVRTYASSTGWGGWTKILTEKEGAQMVKLWENASHTSAFAAQTLTIGGLSNYDMVMVLFSATTSASFQTANVFVPKERSGVGNHVTEARYDGGSYISGRTVTVMFADNTVVFGDGSQNGSTFSNRMIPLYIYGIKGVM